MLIFDGFDTVRAASAFAGLVSHCYGLDAKVYHTQEESDAVDRCRSELEPPVVLVERTVASVEATLARYCLRFGGNLAGR